MAAGSSVRVLADAVSDPVWIADIGGALEHANPRWCASVGAASEACVGLRFTAGAHPDDVSDLEARWSEGTRSGGAFELEARLRQADGSHDRYTIRVQPLADAEPARWLGVATPVEPPDRLRTEQALRESEVRFRATFENAAVGIAHVGLDGRWLRVNDRLCQIVGYPPEEMLTLTFGDITHPDDLDADWALAHRLLAGDIDTYSLEKRYIRRDGSVVPILLTASLVRGPDGSPRYFISVVDDITERKRAEESARESERFTRRVLDNLFAFVGVLDAEGALLQANRAPLQAAGITLADVAGKPFWDAFWFTHDEAVRAQIRDACAAAARGEPVRFDVVIRVAGDERMTIDFQLSPLRDAEGRITHLIPSAVDITDRARSQEALLEGRRRLQEANTLLSALVEGTPDVVAVVDTDYRLLVCNEGYLDTFRQIFGLELSLGDDVVEALADLPEEQRRFRELWARALAGERFVIEAEFGDEARRRKLYGLAFNPLFDADGKVFGAAHIVRDMSERKRAEDALRESEERFRTLADNISQLTWMADETGSIFWYNQRWLEYTGATLEELAGWKWTRVHHPDHVDRVVQTFEACIRSGEPGEDTFPMRGADGTWRWFLARVVPVRAPDGRVERWLGTNTDITAQREVEEALQDAARRKDEFLAMLAHELRNPLAPIRNGVHVLRMLEAREPTVRRVHEIIDRQVTHMARLIDDLLDVSRIARGLIQLRRERCDLAAIVRETAEDHRLVMESDGLTLTVAAPDAPLWVDGDRTRLAQMVGNLLHNAGKFTDPGGRVEVTVEAEDGCAVVTVRDNGVGLDPEMLSRLFEPFSQGDATLARSKGGLGLGLALVHGLAQLHGGSVRAHSEGPGQGAAFTIRLPLIP